MLQNLKDITGEAPQVRIGGTTANHWTWVEDQTEAIIQNFAIAGATLGPNYLQSFKTFPKGTKYIMGVTFDSGAEGEELTVSQAEVFQKGLGDDLYALEVGNEFDGECTCMSVHAPVLTPAS
jgi:hypothetical protein